MNAEAVQHALEVSPDADALAFDAAAHVMARAGERVDATGRFTIAVSGGSTPWKMFEALLSMDMPWASTTIYQVDERLVPLGDPQRNLGHLMDALGGAPAEVVAMGVDSSDPAAAANEYADMIPATLDLVHLGLGADGHTASLVPGDPVLEVADAAVALTGTYQGHRRMTLTYPGLARADELLWLVAGDAKAVALERLLAGDRSIPAGRVCAAASLVMADRAAAGGLS